MLPPAAEVPPVGSDRRHTDYWYDRTPALVERQGEWAGGLVEHHRSSEPVPETIVIWSRPSPHWLRESGLADLLPSLTSLVWVGVSAGSVVLTPRIGPSFVEWPSAPDDRTLGLVDFSIFSHLGAFATNTPAHAERWAAEIGAPAYAIDEQTAIAVVDGCVEVVSEGTWTRFG